MNRVSSLIAVCLLACTGESTTTLETCEVHVDSLTDSVSANQTVVLTGRPFTALLDTSIRVDDISATIQDVARNDCDLCDVCRVEAECTFCEECTECATSCESCIETITFTVPDLSVGEYTLVVRNAYGMSQPATIQIDEQDDTGSAP